MIPASKRSRNEQPQRSSKSTIDNLPDLVLVEILCRLPHHKVAFRCKLVSKRWRTILSDPYFANRFLQTQHDQQKPLVHQYLMIPSEEVSIRKTLVLTIPSEPPPLLEASSISSIFSFLPCLQKYASDREGNVYVYGSYNDLVLCAQGCDTKLVYYICNPYTKKCIRLPPSPPGHAHDIVTTAGFICEPYYDIKEEGSTNNSSAIKLHAEYRCMVVQLITKYNYAKCSESVFVEIFSFETGEWREYSLSRMSDKQRFLLSILPTTPGIACNGKLYWLTKEGSIFELDPINMCGTTSDAHVIDQCRFIDPPTLPTGVYISRRWYIGVCRGHLQMCLENFNYFEPMVIWELKKNEVDGKPEWCILHQITFLSEMVPEQRSIGFRMLGFHPIHRDMVYLRDNEKPRLEMVPEQRSIGFRMLGFHPIHRDMVYLRDNEKPRLVMCNVSEKTLEIATVIPSENSPRVSSGLQIVPYVIPWWPSPVPTRCNFRKEYLNITVTVIGTGVDTFILKVGSFTTVKQLKQELEEKKGHRQLGRVLHFDGRVLYDDDKWLADYGIKDNSNITLERQTFL